jgi:hypothetical protein
MAYVLPWKGLNIVYLQLSKGVIKTMGLSCFLEKYGAWLFT